MAYQSEAELELQFIDQLNKQGYSTVSVPDYEMCIRDSLYRIFFASESMSPKQYLMQVRINAAKKMLLSGAYTAVSYTPLDVYKRQLLPLSGQNGSLKANNTSRRPSKGRQLMCGSSWRFFRRRSLRRERTRMAGIHFSSCKANVSFSPFAL